MADPRPSVTITNDFPFLSQVFSFGWSGLVLKFLRTGALEDPDEELDDDELPILYIIMKLKFNF